MDIAYLGEAPRDGDSKVNDTTKEDFTRDRIESKDEEESKYPNRVKARI